MSASSCPVIVVTGANGGIGYGICQRLIFNLASRPSPDALPQANTPYENLISPPIGEEYDALKLIMACRSVERGEIARQELLESLEDFIQKQKVIPGYDGYAESFRSKLEIEVVHLDLSRINTVFQFAQHIIHKYSYVSHLIFNAGIAPFRAINWLLATYEILRNPINAVTKPIYYLQNFGQTSSDGLGLVWQSNVFGHYVLWKQLQQSLSLSKCALGARVLWVSSLEAAPIFYEEDDWQLVHTEHPYESSKYQIDLIATALDRRFSPGDIRHIVTQPGVVHTKISAVMLNWFLELLKLATFYFAYYMSSPHHVITPYKGASSAVHLSLIPLTLLNSMLAAFSPSSPKDSTKDMPVRFGSEIRKWKSTTGITPVIEWHQHAIHADELLTHFDGLYEKYEKQAHVDE